MHSWKYRLILVLLFSTLGIHAFEDMKCLDSNFTLDIQHYAGPVETLPRTLNIEKRACDISIKLNSFYLLNEQWKIDVCREPVHFKNTFFTQKIIKTSNETFSSKKNKLFSVIQDDGLIYAEGEKEQLGADHGRVYCSFLLIKKYLNQGFVFSREEEYKNILKEDYVEKNLENKEKVIEEPSSEINESEEPKSSDTEIIPMSTERNKNTAKPEKPSRTESF